MMLANAGYPQVSSVESILSELGVHTWKDPEIRQTMGCEPGKSKRLAKENLEEIPHKVIQTAKRAQHRDSPSESACYLSTHTVLFSSH